MQVSKEVRIYVEPNGKNQYSEWLAGLDFSTQRRVLSAVDRLALGGGDVKRIGKHLSELRLHFGAGYRVYYTTKGETLVIILAGSDKDNQKRTITLAAMLAERARNEIDLEK